MLEQPFRAFCGSEVLPEQPFRAPKWHLCGKYRCFRAPEEPKAPKRIQALVSIARKFKSTQQHSACAAETASAWQQHNACAAETASEWQQHSACAAEPVSVWQQHSACAAETASTWWQHSACVAETQCLCSRTTAPVALVR